MKLVVAEAETAALVAALGAGPALVASAVAEVELRRAVRRAAPAAAVRRRAEEVLATLYLVEIDGRVRDIAAELEPATLRTLDALHLATALSLGGDLEVFVAYDERLAAAARSHELPVASPGR